MPRWITADIPSQAGRTAVVTGPGGLGFETGLGLARAGATVILAGRNPGKGAASVAAIRDQAPGAEVRFEALDLASLASVAGFCGRMTAGMTGLDILVNNAGVMAPPKRQVTADGFELQLGTNYLGHFALTAGLLPLLRAGAGPRVVSLSSVAHRQGKIQFGDLQFERRYLPWGAYAQSKLAMLMFALELQRRSDAAGWGLMSNAAHPGFSRTALIANGPGAAGPMGAVSRLMGGLVGQSAAAGALPTLMAATAPEAKGGAYYGPTGPFEIVGPPGPAAMSALARDPLTAARLWAVSEALTGVRFGR